ncbi:MAG TPA: cytochrome c [Burkholderiales bacterium]
MKPLSGAARGMLAGLLLALAGPGQAADIFRGGQLYAQHCAACHGGNGIAVLPGAPSFARQERLMQPDMVLLESVKRGKGPMPGFLPILRDQDILDIIAYVRTLRR